MVDEPENDDSASYAHGFNASSGPQSLPHHSIPNFAPAGGNGNDLYGNTTGLMGQYEPMLDADPFGLSASMHFQTPFSYEQSNARQ